MRVLLALLLMFSFACAATRTTTRHDEIELTIMDVKGMPIINAIVFEYNSVAGAIAFTLVDGWTLRINGVTRPRILSVYKPGYAPSYPKAYPPGPVEIRLYRVGFAN